ncbi:MAG: response regulator [Verrucomicrobia subdivision 3 bacterium]|nr:response regulator [Limisphaerales bacterium]
MDPKLTVLIVEDNENDALLLDRACSRVGRTNPVHIVRDGAEAIEYLKGQGPYANRDTCPFPDVLFIDLKMPRVNGFELLDWMRQDFRCSMVPSVVFTSSAEDVDVERAYRLGANAYFVKPASLHDLEEMLRTVFDFWSFCVKPSPHGYCA